MKREYLNIISTDSCTGCGACSAICPHNCIMISEDKDGFLMPEVEVTKCVHCNLCKKVCPVLNSSEAEHEHLPIKVYAAKNKNQEISAQSSSGGVFSVFAENILKKEGTVYGVAFNPERVEAHHIRVTEISDLNRIRGSKYLHSFASDAYPMVKDDLENNRYVLFSGTPCQVASLRHYLRKEYPKLLCIEVVCHGVPTNMAFRRYLGYLQNRYKSRVTSVNFRDKTRGWNDNCISFTFENGKRYIQKGSENLYTQGYVKNLFVRNSCTVCRFKAMKSGADITLGDMWGLESILPDYDRSNGVSMVSINTTSGEIAFMAIKDKITGCIEVTYDDVKTYNACIYRSVKKHKKRLFFFQNCDEWTFDTLIKKCLDINLISAFRSLLLKAMNIIIPNIIKIKHHISH